MKVAAFYPKGERYISVRGPAFPSVPVQLPSGAANSVTSIELIDYGDGSGAADTPRVVIEHASGHSVVLTIAPGDGWLIEPSSDAPVEPLRGRAVDGGPRKLEGAEETMRSSDAPGLEPDEHG